MCSVVSDSATSWTIAHQAPLSMGFSRQEHWSGLPFSLPGDVPHPGTNLTSPAVAGATWEPLSNGHTTCAQLWPAHCDPMDCMEPTRLLCPCSFPGKLLFPTPGELTNPGIEPTSRCLLHWQADSLPLHHLI